MSTYNTGFDDAPQAEEGQKAKDRYQQLKQYREPFLKRARDCAKLTIPSLLPPEGHGHNSTLPQPYQGLGAHGVSHVSNRIMVAMLPAGANHFTLSIPISVLVKSGTLAAPADIVQQLAMGEKLLQEEIDRLNWRAATGLTAQHLLVTGNALEHLQSDGNLRVYRLDQYVVVRDPVGTLTEIVIAEEFNEDSLPPNLRALVSSKDGPYQSSTSKVCLYTWIRWRDGRWDVHQELEDKHVPGTDGTFAKGKLPFWPLRWAPVIGEDYGRGKVEEHIADLTTLDALTKALRDGAAMAARNITLIRPNAAGGLNLRRRIAQANNGDMIVGNPEDVVMLQFMNANGMQFVAAQVQEMKQELGAAFLLGSAMRRDAERVTATEMRQLAEELDGALGGIYSVLNQDMARPRLERLIFQLQAQEKFPKWPEGMVEPTLLVGLEALGRQRDLQRVAEALQVIQALPPPILEAFPKWETVIGKVFMAVGLPDAVNTQAEVAAKQEQQMLMEAMKAAAPQVAGNLTAPQAAPT